MILIFRVRPSPGSPKESAVPAAPAKRVFRDRPHFALITVTFLIMLSVDLFMVAMPIYVHESLRAPGLSAILAAIAPAERKGQYFAYFMPSPPPNWPLRFWPGY
ncbi:hypothetical protein [Psychromicrobium xiongbiense]|uniref:hypothetical protein n=1 Tax=Psychromicrobium xiongbiense TaxID=3051184 RepID=UPI002557A8B3|nr:hypothetical protein [Psychromicrobium sp. YIM S02556]